jgi:hypothetical protein
MSNDKPYKNSTRATSVIDPSKVAPEIIKLHEKLQEKFPDEYVPTSGFRAGDKNSKFSWHHEGKALDVRANPTVFNYLVNDPEGIELLATLELGIFDETDPKNMGGASGPHYHIGKDSVNVTKAKARHEELKTSGQVKPIKSYKEANPLFDYNGFIKARDSVKGNKDYNFNNFTEGYLKDAYSFYEDEDGETVWGGAEDVYTGVTYTKQSEEYVPKEEVEKVDPIDEEELRKTIMADLKKEMEIERLQKEELSQVEGQARLEEEERLNQLEQVMRREEPVEVPREEAAPQQAPLTEIEMPEVEYKPLPSLFKFTTDEEENPAFPNGGEFKSQYGWDYKKEDGQYYTRKTGTESWITPKGEALTAIQKKVFGDIEYSKEERQQDYKTNVQALLDKGRTIDDLVKAGVGTKEGLTNMFQPNTETKVPTEFQEATEHKEQLSEREGFVSFMDRNSSRFVLPKVNQDTQELERESEPFDINKSTKYQSILKRAEEIQTENKKVKEDFTSFMDRNSGRFILPKIEGKGEEAFKDMEKYSGKPVQFPEKQVVTELDLDKIPSSWGNTAPLGQAGTESKKDSLVEKGRTYKIPSKTEGELKWDSETKGMPTKVVSGSTFEEHRQKTEEALGQILGKPKQEIKEDVKKLWNDAYDYITDPEGTPQKVALYAKEAPWSSPTELPAYFSKVDDMRKRAKGDNLTEEQVVETVNISELVKPNKVNPTVTKTVTSEFFDKAKKLEGERQLNTEGVLGSTMRFIYDKESGKIDESKVEGSSNMREGKVVIGKTYLSPSGDKYSRHTIDMSDGILVAYQPRTGKKEDRKDVEGGLMVSDYLYDMDFTDGYTHEYAKSELNLLKEQALGKKKTERKFATVRIPTSEEGVYIAKVVKVEDLVERDFEDGNVYRQSWGRLSDFNISEDGKKIKLSGKDSNFVGQGIPLTKSKEDKTHTIRISGGKGNVGDKWLDINSMDLFAPLIGGTVTLVSNDGTISKRVTGSLADVVKEAQKIKESTGEDVHFLQSDSGTMNAKPLASDGKVTKKSLNNMVNQEPWAGASEILIAK